MPHGPSLADTRRHPLLFEHAHEDGVDFVVGHADAIVFCGVVAEGHEAAKEVGVGGGPGVFVVGDVPIVADFFVVEYEEAAKEEFGFGTGGHSG